MPGTTVPTLDAKGVTETGDTVFGVFLVMLGFGNAICFFTALGANIPSGAKAWYAANFGLSAVASIWGGVRLLQGKKD